MVEPVKIQILESDFAQLERLGSPYNYGGKAQTGKHNCSLNAITPEMLVKDGGVDCSGYARWALARATSNKLIIPDGSQNQREWAERNLRAIKNYADEERYMTQRRLFINFIKPFANGCGSVGHVFFIAQFGDGRGGTKAWSLESHGGGGCTSRKWNYPTLLREWYNGFELPTV